MDNDLYVQISEILLTKIQENSACHQKYYYILLNIFKNNIATFYDALEKLITAILRQGFKTKNIYVERSVNFFVLFCTSNDTIDFSEGLDSGLLHERVLKFLLKAHNLDSEIVRYRACQLISDLLNKLEDAKLDETLYDDIKDAMLQRLEDFISEVRLQAVYAIYRLQDPDNSNCIITKHLTKRMYDVRPKIRKVCVEKIAVQKQSLGILLKRIRDVSIEVRLAAFLRVSKLCKCIKIKQRQRVIRNGFFDESERVRLFVKNELVTAWLNAYDNDYMEFLHALRLDATYEDRKNSIETIQVVLNSLFRSRPWEEVMNVLTFNNRNTIPLDALNWEASIYWRFLIDFCRQSDQLDIYLDTLIPDLVVFVSYIKQFCDLYKDNLQFEFILNQFFIVTAGYDLADPASQCALNNLVKHVLNKYDLHESVVEILVKNLEKSIPRFGQRENFVVEIISDLKFPMTDEDSTQSDAIAIQISEMKKHARQLKYKQELAIQEMDYDNANEYKNELEKLTSTIEELTVNLTNLQTIVTKTDSTTLLRCLKISRAHLKSSKVVLLSSTLKNMCEEIVELLTHTDVQVRAKALECYALCCIIDEETAKKGIHVFYTVMMVNTTNNENEDVESLLISIKATIDLLSIYGREIITPNDKTTSVIFSFTDVIRLLVNFMDDENVSVQEWSGRGLCNLILNGKIFSSTLISRMILKWCNPASEEKESERLKQMIGIMLENLPNVVSCGDHLEKAFFLTVDTLLNAPPTSPLNKVNVFDIIKFMLQIFKMCDESLNLHKNLSVKLCHQIKDHIEDSSALIYGKTLLVLDLLPYDKITYDQLLTLCDELRDEVHNRVLSNNIIKFQALLSKLSNENAENIENTNTKI